MSKGDAAYASQHVHGVVPKPEPPAPKIIEQRVADLEVRVEELEATVKALSTPASPAPEQEAGA